MIRLIYSVVLLLAALSFGMTSVPCSAKAIHLSADSLFKIIDERSRTLRLASLYAADAAEGVAVARSRRLPVVSASLSVGYLGNGYLTARDFSGGMGIHNPHSNNNFALEAAQVVYDGGAVSGGIRLATLKERMSRLDVEQSRRQVRFMLLGWLTDLQCLHNRRRVLDENIGLARQVVADMKARYDNGVVLGSDIMRYELYLEELQLQREKLCEKLRTTNYRLANALGFPTGDTEFVPGLPADSTWTAGTEQSWYETAAMSSLTLRKAALAVDLSETGRRIAAAGMKPRVSLYAYGRFDSPIVTEVPVLNKNFMYWGAGVSVSFDISSFYTTKRRVRQAAWTVSESREAYNVSMENVRNGIKEAYESYKTAAVELRTKEKSLDLARRNYQIISDRYACGLALITEMLDAANMMLDAETGLENARIALLFCRYRMEYVTDIL